MRYSKNDIEHKKKWAFPNKSAIWYDLIYNTHYSRIHSYLYIIMLSLYIILS